MELKHYLAPLRKWWWLILVATLLSTMSSFVATRLEVPQYQTRTTLMIGQAIEDPNPQGTSFYLTQQLAQSYADIANRQPVRQATMERLGLTWLPQYTVRMVANTQLLEIVVIDTDPVRAQVVANTLAEQLVAQSPTSSQQESQQRQQFINEQLDDLESKIKETQDDIATLQGQLQEMVSARQIADTQGQIATLQTKLNTLQTNYSTLLSNTQGGALNSLRIIETAALPRNPINSNKMATILLGAAIGFVLSAGAAYLMEYMDDTLKTPDEISRILEVPIIGFVAQTGEDSDPAESEQKIIVVEQPRSPITEAFRTLRTNLEFAGVDTPLKTILVTSPNPADGKSTVAANLAAIIAQSGKQVILVDADLRRPRIHRYMNLPNRFGLSEIFRDQLTVETALQKTTIDNLEVITSGSLPPNPAELLGSAKMKQILSEFEQLADIVILDSPPFMVSDSSILAAKTNGVLLVIQPGRTNKDTLTALKEQLARADAHTVGVVLNRIPRKQGAYYGGYKYYSPYYTDHYYLNEAQSKNGVAAGEKKKTGVMAFLDRFSKEPTPDSGKS